MLMYSQHFGEEHCNKSKQINRPAESMKTKRLPMSNTELSQLGSASVNLIDFDGIQCIKKSNITDVEKEFYKNTAPQLAENGVRTPMVHEIGDRYLILEYVPYSISSEELCQSPKTYIQLSRLHSSTTAATENYHGHKWSNDNTALVLRSFELPSTSVDALNHIQSYSHLLFKQQAIISGDSNCGNWGVRENGDFVLFDWERFGRGCPTIDLAPLIKGMGTISDFEYTIERYSEFGAENLPNDPLTNLIVAKAWIAIDVINLLVQKDKPQQAKYLEWFNSVLPEWLYKMAKAI
jgi:hypothetical protein